MNRILRSMLRISVATILAIALLVLLAAVADRQPGRSSIEFSGNARASSRRLRNDVEYFCGPLRPRSSDRPQQLDRSADYISAQFRQAGGRVREQPFQARKCAYRNVIADFGPSEGARLIVGAHYDAFSSTGDLPGADDNASGTAGLLELARLLAHARLMRPVELVAFTTEEPPFFASDEMGSAIHAASLKQEAIAPVGMICLEMIGYFHGTQRWPSPLFSLIYPNDGTFVAVAGGWSDRALTRTVKAAMKGAGGVPVCSISVQREMLDASDQRNYWNRGWPAVMVTDTAYFRNPNYHSSNDTPETLDYTAMAHVVDGVFNAITTLAK